MHIDTKISRGRVAANGNLMPEEAAALATSALVAANAEHLSDVIVNFKDVFLTRALSITECHEVGVRLAQAGRALGKVAVVARPECVGLHHFVFMVARNRGLQVATFASEPEAEVWLAAA